MKITGGPMPDFMVIQCRQEHPAAVSQITREMLHPQLLEMIRGRQIMVSLREFTANCGRSAQERTYAIETMLQSLDPLIIGKFMHEGQCQDSVRLQQFLHFHVRPDHVVSIAFTSKDAVSPSGIKKGVVAQKVEVSIMLIPENGIFTRSPSFKSFEVSAILVDPAAGCRFYNANDLQMARLYLGRMVPLYLDASDRPQKAGEETMVKADLWQRIVQGIIV